MLDRLERHTPQLIAQLFCLFTALFCLRIGPFKVESQVEVSLIFALRDCVVYEGASVEVVEIDLSPIPTCQPSVMTRS